MVSTVPGTTPPVLRFAPQRTHYPADFPLRLQPAHPAPRRRHARRKNLTAFAPPWELAWVEAHLPRIYLDANPRHPGAGHHPA